MRLDKDFWYDRAEAWGLGREQALEKAQRHLESLYPKLTRAVSLNNGVIKIITADASVASDLRLRQTALLRQLQAISPEITKLHIQIRDL